MDNDIDKLLDELEQTMKVNKAKLSLIHEIYVVKDFIDGMVKYGFSRAPYDKDRPENSSWVKLSEVKLPGERFYMHPSRKLKNYFWEVVKSYSNYIEVKDKIKIAQGVKSRKLTDTANIKFKNLSKKLIQAEKELLNICKIARVDHKNLSHMIIGEDHMFKILEKQQAQNKSEPDFDNLDYYSWPF